MWTTLTDADFTSAEVRGATFFPRYDYNTSMYFGGLTLAQLYSTASYQAHDLTGISLGYNHLVGGNFAGQNLTNAGFSGATLTGAVVRGASLISTDFTLAQLYSTASYQAKDLSGISLWGSNLDGGNFAGQNLTNASLGMLTGADLSGAEVRGATPGGISLAQLYSTASYQAHDLTGISLGYNHLAGGNFAGQNLTNAGFRQAYLTDADFTVANVRGVNFDAGDYNPFAFNGWSYGRWVPRGTGISPDQLYSTASYQAHDLSGISLRGNYLSGANFARADLTDADFGWATLTDADFREANLTNAYFNSATLVGADLTAVDARGAYILDFPASATTTNLIRPDGHIDGLDLDAGGLLVVRDYDGSPYTYDPYGGFRVDIPHPPIPITVDQHFAMVPAGTLRMVFEADAWDSTISFAPGIPVTLGGTLELTFADDVNLASQLGRTFDLFDWTGVTPTGTFAISSPYAWDVSNLYTTGQATLTAIPEPSAFVLFVFAVTGWCVRRTDRKFRKPINA